MGRGRKRGSRDGPVPGIFPIDSGTAELIQDRDNPLAYLLLVNGVYSSHIDLSDPARLDFEYMRWIAAVIANQTPGGEPMRVLHLGAAACSLARHLIAVRPGSHHLAVDIDAELSRLVREWFDLPKAPVLRIRVGEARAVLQTLPDRSHTVIVRDVFAGDVTPPALTTIEFVGQAQRVLRPGGLYVLNCADSADLRVARAEAATVGAVFAHLAVIADPPMFKGRRRGNVIIAGSDDPIGGPTLARDLLGGAVPARLLATGAAREFGRHQQPLLDLPAT